MCYKSDSMKKIPIRDIFMKKLQEPFLRKKYPRLVFLLVYPRIRRVIGQAN